MSSKTEFKTIKEFLFQENKTFVIPNYQRGYKWAVRENDKLSAVEKLMEDLKTADWNQQYFLQGITVVEEVVEENNKIILIDGQQRTTTLYLLLWVLEYKGFKEIDLDYDIREESKEFLKELKKQIIDTDFKQENQKQDIYYFIEAIKQIKRETDKEKFDKENFIEFLLNKVTILYIVIGANKATKTFTMMNGSKATMLPEELSKAEILRRISLPENNEEKSILTDNEFKNIPTEELKEIIAKDWETNALRSRYAREWDKWLYWWNRDDVKKIFGIENPMGLLLQYFHKRKEDKSKKFSFDNFRNLLNENGKKQKQKTKLIFKELKNLQKSFEDIFNDPVIYNYLGLALIKAGDDKFNIINYFIENKNKKKEIKKYAYFKLIGATHIEIIEYKKDEIKGKQEEFYNALGDNKIYYDAWKIAFKELLRLNVKEDIKLNRKFDFNEIANSQKSLEHIFPKSKVYHKNEEGKLVNGNDDYMEGKKEDDLKNDKTWLNRERFEKNGTEHCIGNLVLLYKNENSGFGAKSVNDKKKIYFNIEGDFKSRHLLHTISVFAKDNWGIEQIQENKQKIIDNFNKDYDFIK